MPIITNTRRNGNVVTSELVDSVGIAERSYTFPDTTIREKLEVSNQSANNLIVSVGTQVDVIIYAFQSQTFTQSFTDFKMKAQTGHSFFRVRASYYESDEEDERTLATQLAETATNLKTIGIVVNDDTKATANTAILKDLFLNSKNPIFLPEGAIAYNDTLTLGVGVKVFGTPNTTLRLLSDVNGVIVNDKTVLEYITLSTPSLFSKTAILIDGTKRINTCTGRNIRVEGAYWNGYTGTGIRASAMNVGDHVAFVDYENIYIKGTNYGIIIEDDQANGKGWANGNSFNKVSIICNHGVRLTGDASGNEINLQYQTVSTTVCAIYCEGDQNRFSGFVWDIDQYGSTGKIAVFTQKSKENVIALPPVNIDKKFIIDNGTDNLFLHNTKAGETLKPVNTKGNYTIFSDEFRHNEPVFYGYQDNCLAFIDKKATVTVTGNIVYSPGTSHLFNSRNTSEYFFAAPALTPVVIEIDTSSAPISAMYAIGMTFMDGCAPSDYSIEVATTSDGAYAKIIDVKGNKKSSFIHLLSKYGLAVYKIRITFTKAIQNATLNPTNQVRLSNIYGANNGSYFDSPYLFKDGGKMYGDLDMNSTALKNVNFTQLVGTTSAIVPNNTIFLESNVLKFKDSAGVVKIVNLT
ncbi:hypothetical protein ACFY5J_04575 [Peribacillus butanolivorans]|uniref:hypothetical protein n=1 Tax=Peribacillus butanolivorans TaxID=421767 RepID=UPI003699410B